MGAVVYAPRAEIVAHAGLELYGSVFAAGFSAEAATRFHYDRAVLSAGVSCGSPAQPAVHAKRPSRRLPVIQIDQQRLPEQQ